MINPIAFQIGGLSVRWYGLLIVIGILLALAVANHNCKKYKVGDTLKFIPDYGALLKLTTSKYVHREYAEQ